ncbi:serine hydrolase [Patescibacteria group bacterium]|nr:serine hydrolase [Patescibacteria group bacterium]
MDIRRWIILLSILALFLGIYRAAHAEILDTINVNFDQPTLQKGYTVKSVNKQLWIPIFPKQFEDKLSVRISKADPIAPVPNDLQPASDFFIYNVAGAGNELLSSRILLSFAYDSVETNAKTIYYYDENKKEWEPLDSRIVDLKKKIIQARINLSSAQVVVLEKKPNLLAAAAIVMDKKSGNIVFQQNINEERSLASLTKLMTAMVFLEHSSDWNKRVTMQKSDFVGGSSLNVREGDVLSARDLFHSLLVGSKNNAAEALIRATDLSRDQFIWEMNKKAKDMNLAKTTFVDPSGLDGKNISTAAEMLAIANAAFKNSDIAKASSTKIYTVHLINREWATGFENTSRKILNSSLTIVGSKTGHIDESGYNLVTEIKSENNELIALVLGSDNKADSYDEVYRLLKKYL